MAFSFEIVCTSKTSKARIGKLSINSNENTNKKTNTTNYSEAYTIETPVFMPVGTLGTVKTLTGREIFDLGFPIILNNTYHLVLRPGLELIKQFKGIKNITRYPGAILTDSGGFQLFSLAKFSKVTEEGVYFSNHLDGSYSWLTPESVIDYQQTIGSDIMMPLDHLTAANVEYSVAEDAHLRTLRWAKRTQEYIQAIGAVEEKPTVFAITQGNIYPELKRESTRALVDMDFPGYAIGGLSVGEGSDIMYPLIDLSTDELPIHKVRYLMGVGEPSDLAMGIQLGIDMFDCVFPTRVARNGLVFTWEGRLNLMNSQYQTDESAIDASCNCIACQHYSRAYLRHLFKTGEMLGMRLATIHNLTFLLQLIKQMKDCIRTGGIDELVERIQTNYK